MQRLFTSFPSGAPGAGLLLLRLMLGTRLSHDGWLLISTIAWQSWTAAPLCILGASLVLGALTAGGLFTPIVQSAIAGFYALSIGLQLSGGPGLGGVSEWQAAFVAAVAVALALLGPGAYSIDAHRYGRRTIDVPADSPR